MKVDRVEVESADDQEADGLDRRRVKNVEGLIAGGGITIRLVGAVEWAATLADVHICFAMLVRREGEEVQVWERSKVAPHDLIAVEWPAGVLAASRGRIPLRSMRGHNLDNCLKNSLFSTT